MFFNLALTLLTSFQLQDACDPIHFPIIMRWELSRKKHVLCRLGYMYRITVG